MTVSIVIPNLDSPVIDRTIAAILAQLDEVGGEVIVVGRDTPRRVPCDDRVRFHETPRPVTPAAARNLGAALARTDRLVFVDADCVPEPGWLRALCGALEREVYAAGGAVTFESRSYWRCADNLAWFHAYAPDRPAGPRPFLPTINLAVHRRSFDAIGGFDERLVTAEDLDFTIRLRQAGVPLYFVPAAKVEHRPVRSSFDALWRHGLVSGRNSIRVRRRYPQAFGMPALFERRWALALGAPFVAAASVAGIWRTDPRARQRCSILPALYLAKLAWCLGATMTTEDGGQRADDRGRTTDDSGPLRTTDNGPLARCLAPHRPASARSDSSSPHLLIPASPHLLISSSPHLLRPPSRGAVLRPPSSAPRVVAVVVHWRNLADTERCLRSLAVAAYPRLEIVLVDNGSNDQAALTALGGDLGVRPLRNELNCLVRVSDEATPLVVRLLRSETNRGFAGGANLGLRHTLATGADYALLVNNDATIAPEMVSRLVATAEADARLAVVGPKVLYADDPGRIWYLGGRWGGWFATGVGEDVPDAPKWTRPLVVDFVSGCGLLIRCAALREVGLFDERYFMYYEDGDLCRRFRAAGYRVVADGRARMWHGVSRSTSGDAPWRRYLRQRSRVRFQLQARSGDRVAMLGLLALASVRLGARDLAAGRPAVAWATFRGLWDGWRDLR